MVALALLAHSSVELVLSAHSQSRYAVMAMWRMVVIDLTGDLLWAYVLIHMLWINQLAGCHPSPRTHSSVDRARVLVLALVLSVYGYAISVEHVAH